MAPLSLEKSGFPNLRAGHFSPPHLRHLKGFRNDRFPEPRVAQDTLAANVVLLQQNVWLDFPVTPCISICGRDLVGTFVHSALLDPLSSSRPFMPHREESLRSGMADGERG